MTSDETPLPVKKWPGTWLRDHTFWRDITSTMIGGLLVLVVAFIWAVLMGYLASPGLWQAVGSFVGAVSLATVLPLITLAATLLGAALSWRSAKKEPPITRAQYEAAMENMRRKAEEDDDKGSGGKTEP